MDTTSSHELSGSHDESQLTSGAVAENAKHVARHREAALKSLSASFKRPGPLVIQGPSIIRERRSLRFSDRQRKEGTSASPSNPPSAPPSSFKPFIVFDFERNASRYEIERALLRGQSSRSSRVSWDYFDPEGVQDLRRTLVRNSVQATVNLLGLARSMDSPRSRFSSDSERSVQHDRMAQQKKDDFDFENVLNDVLRQ